MIRSPAKYFIRRGPFELALHSQFNSTSFVNEGTSNKNTGSRHRTAAILVIGDEILKGQVHDTNSHFASKVLYDMGVKVKRIVVIGDCEEDIIQEIKFSSPRYTYVITTGGIGPTHDDITFDAVAKAFEQPVVPHPELVKICSEFFKTNDLKAPALKLAHIPQSAKLTFGFDKTRGRRTFYPNVSVKNVFIFPGVPQLMERLFSAVSEKLFGGGDSQFYLKEIYVNVAEDRIADSLNKVVCEFPRVVFGSYPKFFDTRYKVKLTIESENEQEANKAFHALTKALPQDAIVRHEEDPLEGAYEKLVKHAEQSNGEHLRKTLQIMEKSCEKHSPHEICVYVDGSQESSVVLYLYYACLTKLGKDATICAFSTEETERNEDLNNFMKQIIRQYNIRSFEKLSCPLSAAAAEYLAAHPEKAALVVGSRAATQQWAQTAQRALLIEPIAGWTDVQVSECLQALVIPFYKSSTTT